MLIKRSLMMSSLMHSDLKALLLERVIPLDSEDKRKKKDLQALSDRAMPQDFKNLKVP